MSLLLKSILKIGVPVALTAAAYAVLKLQEKDSPKKEQPHSDAPIIVALGDSITFGSGVKRSRETDCWEYKLEQLFREKYQVLNYGVPGATLQDEGDLPYWAVLRFPQAAMLLKPEIMLLMLGTNDSKPYNWNRERFETQLSLRVEELKNTPGLKKLVLMTPPFACPPDGSDAVCCDVNIDILRDEICPIIRKCAEEKGLMCIDLFALTENHPELFEDGLHPNSLGNHTIARHIHARLTEE